MSRHIKFAKLSKVVLNVENGIDRLHRKIDRKAKAGKYNEDSDCANNHYVGNNDQGRCWSY